MVCAQNAGTKEGEEKDLIKESAGETEPRPSQEKEEEAMEADGETKNAHRNNLEREIGGDKRNYRPQFPMKTMMITSSLSLM